MSGIFFNEDDDLLFDQDEPSQKVDNQSDNKQQEWEVFDKNQAVKTNQKNKYIKKIKDIAPEISIKSLQKQEPQYSQHTIDKKQRNKFSAKQSRDRKKMYIQIMEDKQKKLQQELANKKKQLEETRSYLEKVVNQNQTMSSFTTGRHQMIKRLEILIEKKLEASDLEVHKILDSQINQVLDSLRYRIGATGKERINTINQYFRQIVNLSLPALHRYMMWSASEEKHMFSKQDTEDDWYRDLKEKINLSEHQRQQIRGNQSKLKQQKQLLTSLVESLRIVKNHIQNKSIQLQDMIDNIRQILTPIQSAQFILFIERNKYRKELNLCDLGDEETIKKQIKLQ